MTPSSPVSRRIALQRLATVAVGLGGLRSASGGAESSISTVAPSSRLAQSVVAWCFNALPVPQLARAAANLGLKSVELCDPKFWPELKSLGLTCAIATSHGFAKGFAQPAEHDECVAVLNRRIEECAAAGVGRVITFSGFRRGLGNDEGLRYMVDGFKKIVGLAERRGVTLCLEMLNSRVAESMKGHPDYFCDDLERSVEVCRRVGSERLKVLFDCYHVQIMHGDVITRLRTHAPYIGHVHTAGVPGRHEIDATQELNYPPLMKTLVEIGYTGFVGHEFLPTRDPVDSLAEAVRICAV